MPREESAGASVEKLLNSREAEAAGGPGQVKGGPQGVSASGQREEFSQSSSGAGCGAAARTTPPSPKRNVGPEPWKLALSSRDHRRFRVLDAADQHRKSEGKPSNDSRREQVIAVERKRG